MISTLLIILSYFTGSIPFGVLVARAKGIDIRTVGSGNIGATNVGRALGRGWGFLVFGLDFLKGFGPVLAVKLLSTRLDPTPFVLHDLPVVCALAAVLGHVFSVWLGFRGGKAGATGLGVGAVLCWPAMLAAGFVWLLVVAITRYVALGTMLGSVAYLAAVLTYLILFLDASPIDREHRMLSIFCIVVAALVIVRHSDNIRRLMDGTESKV